MVVSLMVSVVLAEPRYPLVGCQERTTGTWDIVNDDPVPYSVPLTVEGIELCLDTCASRGYVFAGFDCQADDDDDGADATTRCRCHTGRPRQGDFWVLNQGGVKLSTNVLNGTCAKALSPKCPPVGGYVIGGDDHLAVYGLVAAGTAAPDDDNGPYPGPLAVLSAQPAEAPAQNCSGSADLAALPDLADIVGDSDDVAVVVASGEHYALRYAVTLSTLEIKYGGSVTFDPAGAPALNATSVSVYGTLAIGSERCAFKGTTNITLRGPKPAAPTLATKAIIVYAGGTLDVHGAPFAPTWTRLAEAAYAGATSLTLQQPVNWVAGQQIVLVTSRFVDEAGDHENELLTIASVAGRIVAFEPPLQFNHYGGPEHFAEVGLLSRDVVIQGDEQSETAAFGGHTLCTAGALCRLRYALGYRLGQLNVMGGYPFHWHMMGDVGQASYFDGLAVNHSFWRAFTIHGTSNSTLSRSVAYDVSGSAVYLEDAVEIDNVISHNLVAHVHPIAPHDKPWIDYDGGGDYSDIDWIASNASRLIPSDLTPACFYCTNPKNRWIGNAASGGFTGYLFPTVSQPLGFSYLLADDDRRAYEPMREDLLEFDGNAAHSSGQWFLNGASL